MDVFRSLVTCHSLSLLLALLPACNFFSTIQPNTCMAPTMCQTFSFKTRGMACYTHICLCHTTSICHSCLLAHLPLTHCLLPHCPHCPCYLLPSCTAPACLHCHIAATHCIYLAAFTCPHLPHTLYLTYMRLHIHTFAPCPCLPCPTYHRWLPPTSAYHGTYVTSDLPPGGQIYITPQHHARA